MIHHPQRAVNTFFEENALIGRPPSWLLARWSFGEQGRSIQQAKPSPGYENRAFRYGILSGKVAKYSTSKVR